MQKKIVILGTGGTIAGTAEQASDNVGYRAASLGVEQLVAAVPALGGRALEAEQVAQVDSKNMTHALWQRLAQRAHEHLSRPEVQGVVVTHGTDTLEETAYFLHRVLAPAKPLVLTASMRPATALLADGPQNLLDAVTVASHAQAQGVVLAFAGRVLAADGLRKVQAYRIDAFDGPVLATVEEGQLRMERPWPQGIGLGVGVVASDPAGWPRVAWLTHHVGAEPALVDACVQAGYSGIVIAATGNGSLSDSMAAALARAQAAGVVCRRSTRCASGRLVAPQGEPLASEALGPAQSRVALLLELLAQRARG